MPIAHRIDPERRIVYVDVAGSPTTAEMCDAIDRVVADPAFQAGFGILSDHRGLDSPATPEQVRALLAHITELKSKLGAIRWGIVVERTASFGMMRMLALLAEDIPAEVEVFRGVEEARRWLTR